MGSTDDAILTAFKRFQDGHAAYTATDPNEKPAPGDVYTAEQRRCWVQIDAADVEVHALPATTPAGVACKLWIAIVHTTSDYETEHAAIRADLDWFEQHDTEMDWEIRQIVSALRCLKAMEA